MREAALWLHILGGGTWLGANLTQLAVGRGMTGGESRIASRWLEVVEKASRPLYGVASTVILATGLYLVLRPGGAYRFGSAFVAIGIAILIIGGALYGAFFRPQTKKALSLFDSGNSEEGGRVVNRIRSVGMLDTLLIAFAVLVMVSKWGA